MTPRVALAVTVHDPNGAFADGIERLATEVTELFDGVAAAVTSAASARTKHALTTYLSAATRSTTAGFEPGLHRRQSVELALEYGADFVMYSDLDHILRWVEARPDEVRECLVGAHGGLRIVGRTPAAMAACPRRLRETEAIVNQAYALLTGRVCDVMFATRLMSAAAAEMIVRKSTEVTLANDIDWPLLVETAGLPVDYFEADGLSYRITDGFDGPPDDLDSSARHWVQRMEYVGLHAAALRRYMP